MQGCSSDSSGKASLSLYFLQSLKVNERYLSTMQQPSDLNNSTPNYHCIYGHDDQSPTSNERGDAY